MTASRQRTFHGVPIPYDAPIADLRTAVNGRGAEAWVAICALAQKPDIDALNVLIEVSRSSDPNLRRAAVEGIGIHRAGQIACAEVCQALHDRDSFVVRAAIDAAARLRLGPAHDRVLGLLTASEEMTRLSALRALEVLWLSSDFEAVFDRYLNDPSPSVRKQACSTVHKNVGAECWERVFSKWSRDEVPRHRAWACELAGSFGSRAVLPALNNCVTIAMVMSATLRRKRSSSLVLPNFSLEATAR